MDIPVTSTDFAGLTDAYTGELMPVVMRGTPAGPLFLSPSATSPRDYCTSSDGPTKCPYTGEPFVIRVIGGHRIRLGGFDPRIPQPRESFLYYATMRNGAPKMDSPTPPRAEAPIRRGRVTNRHRAHVDRQTPTLTDFHLHSVEKSLSRYKGMLPSSPTVSMFSGRSV